MKNELVAVKPDHHASEFESRKDSITLARISFASHSFSETVYVYHPDYQITHLVNDAAIWDENWFSSYE